MLKSFLPPRRKDAKKASKNAAALCVFAPWREKSFYGAGYDFVLAD